MSVLFPAADHYLYGGISGVDVTGNITILAVIKFTTTDTGWASIVESHTSAYSGPATGVSASLSRNGSTGGKIAYTNQALGGNGSTDTINSADGWCLVAATKADGTTTPRSHVIPIGGTPVHNADAAGSFVDGNSITGGNIIVAGDDDDEDILVAVAAIFPVVLTDGEIDGIETAGTTQSILDLSPSWCVDDSDGLVTDLTGGGNDRTAVTGTPTDDADDPSGWVYFSGGALEKAGSGVVGP